MLGAISLHENFVDRDEKPKSRKSVPDPAGADFQCRIGARRNARGGSGEISIDSNSH